MGSNANLFKAKIIRTLLVGLNENERALISKRLFQEFPQDIPKLLFVYFGNHSCSYQKDPGQTKSSNGEGQNQKSLCCFFLRNNLYHRRTIPNSTSSYIKTVSFDDLHNGWVRYFKQWTDDPYGLIVFILMLFRTNQKLNLDAVGVVFTKWKNPSSPGSCGRSKKQKFGIKLSCKEKTPNLPTNFEQWTDELQFIKTIIKNYLPHIRYFQIPGEKGIKKIKPWRNILGIDLWDDTSYDIAKNPNKFKLLLAGSRESSQLKHFNNYVIGGYNPLVWKADSYNGLKQQI
ncbi:13240_t:CDS:2, partial [Gigaspora rosea]